MKNRLIGDRAFYRRVLLVAVPILIQNGITNFVQLLDNIMVGQIGTLPMSGVSIVNNLMFVFNLCIFGAGSGAGIFTAQFEGSGDHEGIRSTFRFKILVSLLVAGVGMLLFSVFDAQFIGIYLTGEGSAADAQGVMEFGKGYLRIMLAGLLPFALTNAYASTLRETGTTTVPMVGGIAAVFVNLILNYVLIFGHFGAPAMGVQGAALATVLSRFVELAIVAGWTHGNPGRKPFIVGAFRSLRIPGGLLKNIVVKGMPLLVNEFFWSTGMAFMTQCYSTCGLDVVPALNISNTLVNLSSVVYMALGVAVGIIMGQMLGADVPKREVQDANAKLIALSVAIAVVFAGINALCSGLFPRLYDTEETVRHLATRLLLISSAMMPFQAFGHASYFTLRSGGKTYITFLFDSGFTVLCCVPLGFFLSRFTGMSILPLYAICQGMEIVKCGIGAYFLKKGTWIQNLT